MTALDLTYQISTICLYYTEHGLTGNQHLLKYSVLSNIMVSVISVICINRSTQNSSVKIIPDIMFAIRTAAY